MRTKRLWRRDHATSIGTADRRPGGAGSVEPVEGDAEVPQAEGRADALVEEVPGPMTPSGRISPPPAPGPRTTTWCSPGTWESWGVRSWRTSSPQTAWTWGKTTRTAGWSVDTDGLQEHACYHKPRQNAGRGQFRFVDENLKKILFAPTGALLSPTSSFQGESVPGICHALTIEM